MISNHSIDQFKMMNNYFMYQYGIWLCYGLIMTGLLPDTKNEKSSNVKKGNTSR